MIDENLLPHEHECLHDKQQEKNVRKQERRKSVNLKEIEALTETLREPDFRETIEAVRASRENNEVELKKNDGNKEEPEL